jgi:hypothetical protein
MQKNRINISSSEEFKRLIKALSRDIVDAHLHYRLCSDLGKALRQHKLTAIESDTFWFLTLQAHMQSYVHALCRAYDQDSRALHLKSWLLTIKDNLHFFDKNNFHERLKGNPFVDSLASSPRKPCLSKLEEDIFACSNKDEHVKVLIIHRGNRIAHRNAGNVVAERYVGDKHPLTTEVIEELLKRAIDILNRYNNLFEASTYCVQVAGHDDYKIIFKCVEEKMRQLRRQHKR